MLTLLLGRSGSGKTSYILKEIEKRVKNGEKTYLLVPEQQVYISECMLADLPASSALCFEVISFSRLCELVFTKYGGLTDKAAGTAARSLVMWQTLRELSFSLKQYKGIKTDASLTSMMLSAIDELHASSISPETCDELAAKCADTPLANKLSDIAAIYADFQRNVEERLGESEALSENKLSRLAEILRKNDFFSDCNVYIDSFTSFTGEEHTILEHILTQAKNTCISLTYDKESDAPHFDSIKATYTRLKRFAGNNGIEKQEIIPSKDSKIQKAELNLLEKHLWDFSLTKDTRPEVDEAQRGSIETYKCLNEYEEIWLAALNIKKEIARGVKYSEIALISRDPEAKRGIIDAVFEQIGIPYFFSERTDLSTTAPARLILSALRCIAHNFNTVDVLTLLKTGLLGIDEKDVDLFEDYCYTWNISGKLFTADAWSMNPDGYTTRVGDRGKMILDSANRVRAEIIPPLVELRNKFSLNKGDTTENCRALYSYLTSISLSDNLSSQAEYALSTGDVKGAGELLRLYDYIISTLTDISTVLSGTQTGAEELCSAIEIMLRNTDIGSVPAMSDYVTVGSAATLRIENIKTAILVGLCEGEFPASYSDGGILTESDKSIMEKLGVTLDSREDTATSDELFYVYRAMAKPQEKLILSTCRSSVSGRALNPSSAWNRVEFLFPYIKAKSFDLAYIRGIADKTADEVEETDTEDISPEELTEVAHGDSVEIDPLYVRMIFGDKLHLSKSQISSFAECPYKYWCEYILKLREKKISAISYADSGTTIHYILENVLQLLRDENGKLRNIDDAELIELVDRVLKEYVSGINCPLPPSMMYSFSRLRDLSLIMVKSVIDEFNASLFRIVAFEQSISSSQPDALKPMEIKVDDSNESPIVSLGGVIDRIDCYDGEDKKYIRIVDYKTGTHKYNVEKISTGEDLQLPAYLFTATLEQNKGFFGDGADVFPASAQFLSAEESDGKVQPVRSGFLLFEDQFLRAMSADLDPKVLGMTIRKDGTTRSNGALSEEAILNVDNVMRSTIKETAKNMYSGKAPRTPSKEACGFCSMKSTCPVANKD